MVAALGPYASGLKILKMTLVDHFVFGKNGESISMREYGILNIKKADSNVVKRIKRYNNNLVNNIAENNGLKFSAGFCGGVATSLAFVALNALRYDSNIGAKIGYTAATFLAYGVSASLYFIGKTYDKNNRDNINDMSNAFIELTEDESQKLELHK